MLRRGPKKANMASDHLLLRIIYNILLNTVPYEELGTDYLPKKERDVDYWVNRIKSLGYHIQIECSETA